MHCKNTIFLNILPKYFFVTVCTFAHTVYKYKQIIIWFPIMDARLVTPFSMEVFASRLSGKSLFTKNLLLQQNRTPFKKVIWVKYLSNAFLKHCLKLIFVLSTQFRCDGKTGKYAYSYWWLYEWGFQFGASTNTNTNTNVFSHFEM